MWVFHFPNYYHNLRPLHIDLMEMVMYTLRFYIKIFLHKLRRCVTEHCLMLCGLQKKQLTHYHLFTHLNVVLQTN